MKFYKRFLLLPLIIAAFSYLFYASYNEVKDRTLNEFNNQQFALAKQASRGIESFFSYYQRELQFLTTFNCVSELNNEGKILLSDYYKSHSDQIEAITIVDEKGILRYTYPKNEKVIGNDISNQEHIKNVMSSKKSIVSEVFTSVQGFRTIALHVPIINEKGYRGSLAILIPLDELGKQFIQTIRTGVSGYGWMISKNGIELFSPMPGQTGQSAKEIYNDNPSILSLINSTFTDESGTSICYVSPKSVNAKELTKTLTAFYRVSLNNTFWTIIIFTPENEVFRTLASFRNRFYILFSLILIVIIIYFFLSFKASSILLAENKRKALEKVLLESEKRFRIMFELSPAGITLLDENGIIIEVNTSFCKNLGYSKSELKGNTIRIFAVPGEEDFVDSNLEKILSGETLIHEVKSFRKDGSPCFVALYETVILLPDGKKGILSVSNDITERKISQERMLTLSRALESIGECVSITDLDNKIIFVNNAFCRTYGYSREELINKDVTMVSSASTDTVLSNKILKDTIQGGWNGEMINVRKDGSEFPIELSTSLIKDELGNSIALIGIAVDISERKKALKELISSKEKAEESDRLKSAFLANVSHELRTPLNAIIGFSGLMVDIGTEQEFVSYSKIIHNSGYHLLGLVEDILDSSMIETGQLKVKYESVGINSLLNEVNDIILGEKLKENKSDIEIVLHNKPEQKENFIFTDSRKLKQVLINLLKNALKFTDKGFIEFGFTEINKANVKYLKFYVKDSGIGIDSKHHEVIFNIFRQIDDSSTRKYGGTGIGLSIAKRIVEMLEGEIWVESVREKGSIFYFTIPVLSENFKPVKESSDSILETNYAGKTIVIAEDEFSNYEFLRMILTKMNIRVLWAKNGFEAINLCETDSSINLVLMDIKMPDMNGLESTEKIKKLRPDLPVIAQTAHATVKDKEDALRSGCIDYITKPLSTKTLKEILKKYL